MNLEKKFLSVRLSTLIFSAIIVLGVLSLASLLLAYFVPGDMAQAGRLRSKLPYPLVVVEYRGAVSFHDLSENIQAVRRFYENQDFSQVGLRVDFSTEEGEKRLKIREKEVLNKMLEDEAIRILAQRRGVEVTQEMARHGLLRALEEYQSETMVKENLDRLYGWTLDDFQEKVVLPSLYEEKLVEIFNQEVDRGTEAKARIEEAKKALAEKRSFEEVAREFSQGTTAAAGGDLGWFALSQLSPELQEAAEKQKVGEAGEIIESNLGFHILLVKEKKSEDNEDLYHISQIFTPKALFADWLSEEMRQMKIFVWSPDYRYNAERAEVEFKTENMRQFEENLLKEGTGDPIFL